MSHRKVSNALVLFSLVWGTLVSSAAEKPNLVLIFTDDQGYQDVGCFGSPKIKTPHLDRMAQEGRRFTDFYSANSVCSPSRAALLTGCYPPRAGVTRVLFPRDAVGLPPEAVTLAELLKTRGYTTACVGKWHLGHKPQFLPTRQGFDRYFGIPYSNDMWIDPEAKLAEDIKLREGATVEQIRAGKFKKPHVPLMRNEEVVEFPADQVSLTRRYTDEAIAFIRENRDNPFFLYLPHTMPHIPIFASEKFRGKSARGLYGDVIEELDWNVGRLLDAIKEAGLDEKTLVIYTSDNGPWNLKNGHGGCALPLRGYKFQTYEGGHRVPCIMRWPGRIPAGTECGEPIGTIDILPTMAQLAGSRLPEGRTIDGKNVWPVISGAEDAKPPHQIICYYRGTRLEAARMGKWKIRITRAKKAETDSVELFDLSADISESKNLADELPEQVAAMRAAMEKADAHVKGQ